MTSPAATPPQPLHGPIVGNTDGLTRYQNLMGGTGTTLLHRLLSGPQTDSTLDIAEHVVFLNGASCGLHQHTRNEEIYYVLGGAGVVDMDGRRLDVHSGDLIITPLGSTHRVGARDGTDLAILVVEVLPGGGERRANPTSIAMRKLLVEQAASALDGVRVASVELGDYFTGAWGPFQLAALGPGATLGPRTASDAEQFVYVARGHARVEVGDLQEAGGAGLYVVVPPGVGWTAVNTSDRNEAEVVITQVGVP
jgi:quercetin dioxygenase-like cupin family protein